MKSVPLFVLSFVAPAAAFAQVNTPPVNSVTPQGVVVNGAPQQQASTEAPKQPLKSRTSGGQLKCPVSKGSPDPQDGLLEQVADLDKCVPVIR